MCRSEWQTPQCVTSISTSVPFGSGVGSSSSCNGLPFSTTAQARIGGLPSLSRIIRVQRDTQDMERQVQLALAIHTESGPETLGLRRCQDGVFWPTSIAAAPGP